MQLPGLEMDPRLKEGVCDAVHRYGTQFSSSRSYVSAPAYGELEERLSELFGGFALVAPSTSLGHLATMPVLIGGTDAVILDQQVHHSGHAAVNPLRTQGTTAEVVRHNDVVLLEQRIEELRRDHRHVWYMADGVYSMFADLAPVDDLVALLDRFEQLHLYLDDSHGMSWYGRHGRGTVLGRLPIRERMIVANSLNKAFAAAGGALIFPDAELRRRVRTCGGQMVFSGPIQPPMLGAALASAQIHLSPEIDELQAELRERIRLCNALMLEAGLPLVAADETPIRYVGAGLPDTAASVAERMMADGFFVNTAPFPCVPMKKAGIRTPLTRHHTPDDIRGMVQSLARHLPRVLEERGSSLEDVRATFGLPAPDLAPGVTAAPRPIALTTERGGLRLEVATSIAELDPAEWDRLLGDRGSFTAEALGFLERTFRGSDRPEDNWEFRYYVVRHEAGRPVAATFFSSTVWKDDMLAQAEVSRRVEELRADDPYYLTSMTVGMGSLLSEGAHLHLDRSGDWRGALELLLDAVGREQQRVGASMLVLRDFDGFDEELDAFLRARGLVRYPMLESLTMDLDFRTDEELLERLTYRARTHVRREALAWEEHYDVEIVAHGGRVPSDEELEHLYQLYRNVEARGLELNVFDLPPHVFRGMLEHPCWELFLLRLKPSPGARRTEGRSPSAPASSAASTTRPSSWDSTTTTCSPTGPTGSRSCRRCAGPSTTAPVACSWAWAPRSRSAASGASRRSASPTSRPTTTTASRCWPTSRPTPARSRWGEPDGSRTWRVGRPRGGTGIRFPPV